MSARDLVHEGEAQAAAGGLGGEEAIRDSKRKTEREPPHQALSSGVYRFT
jgi:hypothetical protein